MPPNMPDNTTIVPVCQRCWLEIPARERAAIISSFRQSEALENLANAIFDGIDRAVADIVAGKLQRRTPPNQN
jgi:hypothetical protein